jgi:hypothetical protein
MEHIFSSSLVIGGSIILVPAILADSGIGYLGFIMIAAGVGEYIYKRFKK